MLCESLSVLYEIHDWIKTAAPLYTIVLLFCFHSVFVLKTFSIPFLPTLQYHIVLLLLSGLIVLWKFLPSRPSFPRLGSYVVLLLCSVLAALAGLESTKSVYSNSWSQTPVAASGPGQLHHHHHRLCFSHQTLPEHSRVPTFVPVGHCVLTTRQLQYCAFPYSQMSCDSLTLGGEREWDVYVGTSSINFSKYEYLWFCVGAWPISKFLTWHIFWSERKYPVDNLSETGLPQKVPSWHSIWTSAKWK